MEIRKLMQSKTVAETGGQDDAPSTQAPPVKQAELASQSSDVKASGQELAFEPDPEDAKDIPKLAGSMEQTHLFTREEVESLGIIHPGMEDQSVVNSFRHLRTSMLSKMEKYNSCIIVSSIVSGGGASFTAANLAAAFTFDHQKTAMLIDCNFKRSVLSDRLKVSYKFGLKDYIGGQVEDVSKIVYQTGIPRLRLIPSGSSESELVEFFTGEKMFHFLNEVRSRYSNRIIIIDAPPVLDSADTKILAELADYILLVLPYKGVTPNLINKTLNSVDRSKIVGMILNN